MRIEEDEVHRKTLSPKNLKKEEQEYKEIKNKNILYFFSRCKNRRFRLNVRFWTHHIMVHLKIIVHNIYISIPKIGLIITLL